MTSKQPQWLDDAIFYEIYPQSFKDTNADGIGDFQGIIEKLDYIRELGCNALWINPCFLSPFGDAGYDVADYYSVAPRYGTNEDLRRLFDEAHKREMHVLLDLVPGHTSVEHPWFKESMKPEKNEYTDRYVWTNSVWEEPQGMGCIRGISARDGSCAVNFFSSQPALNYGFMNPSLPWQQPMDAPGPRATLEELKNIKATVKPDEINAYILKEIKHGVTVISAHGAYTGEDKTVLMTVCRRSEAIRLRKRVYEIDPSAFMVITKTSEIMGKGFRDNTN